MTFVAPARLLVVGLLIALGTVLVVGADSASAGPSDPVVAIGHADVVFATALVESVPVEDDDPSAADDQDGPSIARGLIGALALVGVLVFGLVRIRDQRRSGRTSKFPRIG